MPKRSLFIQNSASLAIQHNSLLVKQKEKTTILPLEDIASICIETQQVNITSFALSAFATFGITLLICNKQHIPNAILTSLNNNYAQTKIIEAQLNISKPLRKQLWKKIVMQKLVNQAFVLEVLGYKNTILKHAIKNLKSGDTTNQEAVAARWYFETLLPPYDTRHYSSFTGSLDYGYAILRSNIIRSLINAGFLLNIGLEHHNELNAYNLADDMIEAFRPLIDLLVFQKNIQEPLSPDDKHILSRIAEYEVQINNHLETVQTATETVSESLKNAVLNNNAELLKLPEIIGLCLPSLE